MPSVNEALGPERALIFRITHRDNVPWLLRHGVHCPRSTSLDPRFRSIGNQSVIGEREERDVDHQLGGTLGDYVPFYFTPYSPMLLNVVSGRGVPKVPKDELVVLVSSLVKLRDLGIPFLFTDRNAYYKWARFSDRLEDLADFVPWGLLRARDFSRDPERPDKLERYMAEALVKDALPVVALQGIATYDDETASRVHSASKELGIDVRVVTRPGWFFR